MAEAVNSVIARAKVVFSDGQTEEFKLADLDDKTKNALSTAIKEAIEYLKKHNHDRWKP